MNEKKFDEPKREKRLPSIKIKFNLYRIGTKKKRCRNLKINRSSSSPQIKRTRLNFQTD